SHRSVGTSVDASLAAAEPVERTRASRQIYYRRNHGIGRSQTHCPRAWPAYPGRRPHGPRLMSAPSAPEDAAGPAQRASGSSFYAAMRILPPAQRDAMFEIYSFCRAVDDIADGSGPRPERIQQLQAWRTDLAKLYAGTPPRALAGLARAVQTFGMRREDFLAVIDGMEMDVVANIQA